MIIGLFLLTYVIYTAAVAECVTSVDHVNHLDMIQ